MLRVLTELEIELAKEEDNIEKEKKRETETDDRSREFWISRTAGSQAFLLANKKERRFTKEQNLNAFVINNIMELDDFYDKLEKNLKYIPDGTRIQLALFTIQSTGLPHWSAMDLLIEKESVSSFLLDAYYYLSISQEIYEATKEKFPKGKHYKFTADDLPNSPKKDKKRRTIQTQGDGCHVFTIEHIKQLSNMTSQTLYKDELPKIEDKGNIEPGKLIGGLKLLNLFRTSQSWTRLCCESWSALFRNSIGSK